MKVLVLGGGAQGKATIYDLSKNKDIKQITVVEYNLDQIVSFIEKLNDKRIIVLKKDANKKEEILPLIKKHDIIIDLLPTNFRKKITALAIETKKPLVNTSFLSNIKDFAEDAEEAGVLIMPESGLDPGIDLILAGKAVKGFDRITSIESSCGGVPTPEAASNPISYKISWNFEGVLKAYKRDASLVRGSKKMPINGKDIFNYAENIEIEGVGLFERYPNGFSTTYARQLGIRAEVENVGRYTLRWPDHCAFWKKISELGLLDEEEILGVPPIKYLSHALSPKLQYKEDERDMIVLRNEIIGDINGKTIKKIQQVVDKKDKESGLMAMNRTVGFTASIVAQMILNKKIKGIGILNPAFDVPQEEFIEELRTRGIEVKEWEEEIREEEEEEL